jgi:hypothetical protein
MKLEIVPVSFADANGFVARHHRHHKPVVGCKFVLACAVWNYLPTMRLDICGVAICGRPVARSLDDGWTIEINRVCTDGTPNACSILYAAAWRVARGLGYRKCITYTLKSESGTSLRAAGWKVIGEVKGREWSCKSRPRFEAGEFQRQDKLKWSPAECSPASDETKAQRTLMVLKPKSLNSEAT